MANNNGYNLDIGQRLRSLAWRQPFGSAMLHGKVETRRRETKVRGDVLIYTSLNPYQDYEVKFIAGDRQLNRLNLYLIEEPTRGLDGHAIAIGTLIECTPMKKQDEDICFVEYNHNLWCLVFDNVRRIEPFRFQVWSEKKQKMVSAGGQGWGFVPDELIDKIKFI